MPLVGGREADAAGDRDPAAGRGRDLVVEERVVGSIEEAATAIATIVRTVTGGDRKRGL